MFGRARQRMSERMGLVPVSLYAPEFESGCLLVDNTAVGAEKVIVASRALGERYWEPVLKTVEYPSDEVAAAAERLAGSTSAHPPYSGLLLKLSRTQRAEAVEQRNLARDVDTETVDGLRDWLQTQYVAYRAARKKMEKRRVEMDAAVYAARKETSPHHPKRIRAETKSREHTDAMVNVQTYVDDLPAAHRRQHAQVAALVCLQRAFHSKSASLLSSTLYEIGITVNYPPLNPAPNLTFKTATIRSPR